jgi:hypothetical protein
MDHCDETARHNKPTVRKSHMKIQLISIALVTASLAGCSQSSPELQARRYQGDELVRGIYFGEGPASHLLDRVGGADRSTGTSGSSSEEAASLAENRGTAEGIRQASAALRAEEGPSPDIAARLEALAANLPPGTGSAHAAMGASGTIRAERMKILMTAIAKDPHFMSTFAADMYSGNRVRIRAAFERGMQHIVQVAVEFAPDPKSAQGIYLGCITCDYNYSLTQNGGIAFNVNVAINVDSAINVNVAYNVDTVKNITNHWSRAVAAGDGGLMVDTIADEIARQLAGS